MKPGVYTVESWNNKDAFLISADGEFLALTKSELPTEFEGELFVGEKIEIVQITVIRPLGSLDERRRAHWTMEQAKVNMSQRQRDFLEAENERRKKYGAKLL